MISNSEHYGSGLKAKEFKGQGKDFAMWRSQFCTCCMLKGILEALFKKFNSKLPTNESDVLDPTGIVYKEKKQGEK